MTKKNDFSEEKSREFLRKMLKESTVSVTFLKNDGSERKMLCTLKENSIPAEKMPKNTGKKVNSDVLAVFDLEKQDWRSFRYDAIKFVIYNT